MGNEPKDKLSEIDKKIKMLEEQRKQLVQRTKEEERRKRTKRLIEIGATMDSAGIDTLEKANATKDFIKNSPELQKIVAMKGNDDSAPGEEKGPEPEEE